jgi:hypothetical protein
MGSRTALATTRQRDSPVQIPAYLRGRSSFRDSILEFKHSQIYSERADQAAVFNACAAAIDDDRLPSHEVTVRRSQVD